LGRIGEKRRRNGGRRIGEKGDGKRRKGGTDIKEKRRKGEKEN
jgi:hypothetical protein